jgi:nudix-type nucleoside diphosphatase (YffH/AdpP family)
MKDPKIKSNKLIYYLITGIFKKHYQKKDNSWITQKEVYDRGNGSAILLYNTKQKTVILTRQFRLPTYLNGNKTGMMIEVCAGMLDQDNPEQCIIRETEEETGYRLTTVHKVMETYMSPGAVTEIISICRRDDESMKVNEGGGVAHEQENIDVMKMFTMKPMP